MRIALHVFGLELVRLELGDDDDDRGPGDVTTTAVPLGFAPIAWQPPTLPALEP